MSNALNNVRKMRDIKSLRSWGLRDGQDATEYLLDAIASIDDGKGGIIVIPPGDFEISALVAATREGVIIRGSGIGRTRLFCSHTLGPVFRWRRQYGGVQDLTINVTGSRSGAAAGSNYGLHFESEDVVEDSNTRMRMCRVEDVEVINQPSHGIIMVGPATDGTALKRVRSRLNGGHGIAVERGILTGRVNAITTGIPGVLNVDNCLLQNNGGHGLACGHPSDTTTTPALRVVAENCEITDNATNAATRYSLHQAYMRGTNHEIRASVLNGSGSSAGIFAQGRNHWYRNNRYINCTASVQVGNDAAFPTQEIDIEGMTVLQLAQNPAVIVDSGATNVRVKNALPSNITSLITPNVPGAEVEFIPQIVTKTADQIVNNSTTLVDDTHLKFYGQANETFAFEIQLCHSAASGASDLQVAITVPSGTIRYGSPNNIKIDTADAIVIQNPVTASGTVITYGGAAATRRYVTISGVWDNSTTPGFLQVQWAQNTATAGNSVMSARDSWIKFWRKY